MVNTTGKQTHQPGMMKQWLLDEMCHVIKLRSRIYPAGIIFPPNADSPAKLNQTLCWRNQLRWANWSTSIDHWPTIIGLHQANWSTIKPIDQPQSLFTKQWLPCYITWRNHWHHWSSPSVFPFPVSFSPLGAMNPAAVPWAPPCVFFARSAVAPKAPTRPALRRDPSWERSTGCLHSGSP